MKIPLSWLKEYVDVDLPAHELAHRLTMAGVEVGDVIEMGGWNNCFVGEVLEVGRHPNADRLSLCRVSTGAEEMEVVCGAPNVAARQKICFAKVGANLYNTHSGKHEPLRAARIRGVVSEGMICSELELGLGEGHEGIVVLPEDAPLGMPLDEYMGDAVLDLELTPNRLDCLSVLGVAHEVGALTGKTVKEPEISYPEDGAPVAQQASVSIAEPELCHRYTATVITGLSIGPSPQWLQDRLTRAGLRPINNVVDVTNYVMLEFNQPLHAFDLDKVKDRTIIVRRAAPGETLETLDGVQRELNPDVLVIADSHDPVGLGGVIGGANSEIGPGTTSVLLESATFNPYNNRKTAETFRLRTDATQRFEKGLRAELAPLALQRATQLIRQVAGGEIARGIIDIFPDGELHPTVPLTLKRLKQVLGMDLELNAAAAVLQSLGFVTETTGPGRLEATVPYWRNDISIEEDLIEEVVRIIGYDAVPTTMMSTPIPYHRPEPMTELKARVLEALASAGMQETISYPLVSRESLESVGQADDGRPPLRVANPMNAGQEYLRPTLRASLLQTLRYNQERLDLPFRFFEAGRVFLPREADLPEERDMAAGALCGPRSEASWLESAEYLGFFDAKGALTAALERISLAPDFQPASDPAFQPGRCASISAAGVDLGLVGELHPDIRERFDLRPHPVAMFEIDLARVLEAGQRGREGFKSLSRFPAATRDLALLVNADVPAGQVQAILGRHRLVEHVELFDVYTGDNIPAGAKSLALHVYFQSQQKTLTNEEVNRALEGLLRNLERETGATLRTG
jgi:phenylalanyl-tRNA synthetase beta chain